jgi:flagellar motor switch/type III secretory pathway protein FliN
MSKPYRLQGNRLIEIMEWLSECSIVVQHNNTVIERDTNNPNIAHIRVEKQETKNQEPPKPEMPTYEKLAQSAKILLNRNTALETEIGRQHMMLRAYEQQFTDMREAIRRLNSDPMKPDVAVQP